jgi:hypothetical protein
LKRCIQTEACFKEKFTAQNEIEMNYDDKTETLFEDKPQYLRIRLVVPKKTTYIMGQGSGCPRQD